MQRQIITGEFYRPGEVEPGQHRFTSGLGRQADPATRRNHLLAEVDRTDWNEERAEVEDEELATVGLHQRLELVEDEVGVRLSRVVQKVRELGDVVGHRLAQPDTDCLTDRSFGNSTVLEHQRNHE